MLDAEVKIGMRVQYQYADKPVGVVVRKAGRSSKSGDWFVKWDDGHSALAYACNFESVEESATGAA